MYEMSWLALFIRKAHLPLLYSSPLNVTSLIKHTLKYQLASFFSPDTVKNIFSALSWSWVWWLNINSVLGQF